MYKSRLQELCHRRLWNLPDYQTTKDGPDHNPRYSAIITVHGVEFQTPSPCRTSKEAQNNVAKLAFDHFSQPIPKPPSSSPQTSNSPPVPQASLPQPSFPQPSLPATPFSLPQPSVPTSTASSSPSIGVVEILLKQSVAKPEVRDASQAIEIKKPITSDKDNMTDGNQKSDSMSIVIDAQRLYKNQLQTYAQKKNLSLPVYATEREGPPHASCFKCKVTIDGQTFESPQFFPTLKDAEHAAAKVALMSLMDPGAQECDIGLYKNLLQELVQKEGLRLPVYNTTKFGEAHIPTFVSNVEIEGVVYTGQEVKTKKQAETSAAKVAYTNLKERKGKQNQSSLIQAPAHRAQAFTLSSHNSDSADPTHLQHHANSVTQNQHEDDKGKLNQSSLIQPPAHRALAPVLSSHSSESTDLTQPQHHANSKSAIGYKEPITARGDRDSASSETNVGGVETASLPNVQPSPSLPNANSVKLSATGNTSRRRKVAIYSRKANVEIASGGTLLPISDENWVAHSYNE